MHDFKAGDKFYYWSFGYESVSLDDIGIEESTVLQHEIDYYNHQEWVYRSFSDAKEAMLEYVKGLKE